MQLDPRHASLSQIDRPLVALTEQVRRSLSSVLVQMFDDGDGDPNGDGDPADGSLIGIDTSLADGSYRFTGMGTGSYVLVERGCSKWRTVTDTLR